MSVRFLLVFMLALAAPVFGQGFAGLGTNADGFATPARGVALQFPADHGAHPTFRIEWWYLTANLTAADGREYGAQWTLFRTALAPGAGAGWTSPQIWLGHAALTTATRQFTAERLARGGIGQAGVTAEPFAAWIDEWQLAGPGDADLSTLAVSAAGEDFSYALSLTAHGPLVRHGDAGYSLKSAAGLASYYYSQPFYDVRGVLNLPDGPVTVSGRAWLDHEWSSQPLDAQQLGWDWVSLHLEGGAQLMAFQMRAADGATFASGTWIAPDGRATPIADGGLRMTPLARTRVAGRDIPTRWRLELPARGLDVTLEALNPQSWMDVSIPYWEGPVRVRGSHGGRGYLEMTGY